MNLPVSMKRKKKMELKEVIEEGAERKFQFVLKLSFSRSELQVIVEWIQTLEADCKDFAETFILGNDTSLALKFMFADLIREHSRFFFIDRQWMFRFCSGGAKRLGTR